MARAIRRELGEITLSAASAPHRENLAMQMNRYSIAAAISQREPSAGGSRKAVARLRICLSIMRYPICATLTRAKSTL
jgi:hypothetical protein